MTGGDLAGRCAFLGDGWQWWATTLVAMDADAWTRPTRLEGWNVAALVAHHAMFVKGVDYLATHPLEAEPATTSARDMLRRFNADGGVASTSAPVVAEMARQQAESVSREDLITKFVSEAPRVVDNVRSAGPIVIDYFGHGTFPIAEAVAIAILEAVVHGLDLCAAIGSRPDDMPVGPVSFTTELLASLPDPLDFIDAATGRRSSAVLPVIQ